MLVKQSMDGRKEINRMRDKRLEKIEIPKWGKYLRSTWRECFASHLSKEEQGEIWIDDFL